MHCKWKQACAIMVTETFQLDQVISKCAYIIYFMYNNIIFGIAIASLYSRMIYVNNNHIGITKKRLKKIMRDWKKNYRSIIFDRIVYG